MYTITHIYTLRPPEGDKNEGGSLGVGRWGWVAGVGRRGGSPRVGRPGWVAQGGSPGRVAGDPPWNKQTDRQTDKQRNPKPGPPNPTRPGVKYATQYPLVLIIQNTPKTPKYVIFTKK